MPPIFTAKRFLDIGRWRRSGGCGRDSALSAKPLRSRAHPSKTAKGRAASLFQIPMTPETYLVILTSCRVIDGAFSNNDSTGLRTMAGQPSILRSHEEAR